MEESLGPSLPWWDLWEQMDDSSMLWKGCHTDDPRDLVHLFPCLLWVSELAGCSGEKKAAR